MAETFLSVLFLVRKVSRSFTLPILSVRMQKLFQVCCIYMEWHYLLFPSESLIFVFLSALPFSIFTCIFGLCSCVSMYKGKLDVFLTSLAREQDF